MLSKAPCTRGMISVDIRHAALFAISKGWYLQVSEFKDYPFTSAELAVAAATYLEQIPPDVPDDPFYTLSTIKLLDVFHLSAPACSPALRSLAHSVRQPARHPCHPLYWMLLGRCKNGLILQLLLLVLI